ncbi:MAG: DUF58 domain-containing protein [Acidobacteriia bacterium]|nr:DUF58 domain-containing protein [Terriglobia bacterium]
MIFQKAHLRAWIYFVGALIALSIALVAAVGSQIASAYNQMAMAFLLAIFALGLAAAVAVTVVPYLARRVRTDWIHVKISYKITREGWIFFAACILIGLSAVNTGNNLLFMILSAMLAAILVSGVASKMVLSHWRMALDFPERLFAERPALGVVTAHNRSRWIPGISVSIEPLIDQPHPLLFEPVYFPYLKTGSAERRRLELFFTRRGRYAQAAVKLTTQFPFGFIEKSLHVPQAHELLVFPRIDPVDTFFEILPLISGEYESFLKGKGIDLYSLRDYLPPDSARAIHWKASAKSSGLKVKEFAREDERRLLLIFDATCEDPATVNPEAFEKSVSLCACLADHFFREGAELSYCKDDDTLIEGSSEQTLDEIFTELALLEVRPGSSKLVRRVDRLLRTDKDAFKIIFTVQGRGNLPTPLWQSSHVVFIADLFSGKATPTPQG